MCVQTSVLRIVVFLSGNIRSLALRDWLAGQTNANGPKCNQKLFSLLIIANVYVPLLDLVADCADFVDISGVTDVTDIDVTSTGIVDGCIGDHDMACIVDNEDIIHIIPIEMIVNIIDFAILIML